MKIIMTSVSGYYNDDPPAFGVCLFDSIDRWVCTEWVNVQVDHKLNSYLLSILTPDVIESVLIRQKIYYL